MLVPRFAVALLTFTLFDVAPAGGGCRRTHPSNHVSRDAGVDASDAGVDASDASVDAYGPAGQTLVRDGGTVATPACQSPSLTIAACGVQDGLPFYGYYDGCNWVSCNAWGGTTTRNCADGSVSFQPSDCNPTYWAGVGVPLLAGETWVCDATGRLYRSTCAPAGATGL